MNSVTQKQCPSCKKIKTVSCFYKIKNSRNRLSSECKECRIERTARWQKENKVAVNSKNRLWKIANRDKVLQKRRDTYKNNKEKIEKQNRAWEIRNKEKVSASHKKWKRENKDKVWEYKITRRAREHGSGDIIKMKEWTAMMKKYNHTCLRCGSKENKLTLDHVIPLSKGGRNIIENAQPLCLVCNSIKGTNCFDYRK